MSKLRISDSLSLPPETVTSTLIVYGGKGMGKTNFGAVLVEEMSRAGLRWSVLDPMGVWWGLRHAKDGKGKGVECLILGGAHGDIPIEPTGGAVVADLVADENVNVIIDFSRKPNGESWGVGEKIRFVSDYGQRIFQRQGSLVNGKRREPMFQVLDEAARFIPQMIHKNQDNIAMCLSVWAQIVEEGRNHGLGVCLLTQRSARLNKDVAELADVMIAFRTVGPNSVGAITDWLGEHVPKERTKEIVEKLRALPVGSCLVVSPGWLQVEDIVHIRERQTFDSSATPKPGESQKRVTGEAAKPDLQKYAALMKETIERQKENDPKELKRRIAELEKELKKKHPHSAPPKEVKVVDQAAIQKAVAERDKQWSKGLQPFRRVIQEGINAVLQNAQFPVPDAPAMPQAVNIHVITPAPTVPARRPVTPPKRTAENNGSGDLPKGELKMLCAVAQYPEGSDRNQLTVLTGFKRSTRDKYLQLLQQKGYVEVSGNGSVLPTNEGFGALGDRYQPLPTGEELQSYWLSRLPEGERRILEILVNAGGNPVTREQIDEQTGYSRSTRDKYLQLLQSRRLAESIGRGEVQASKNLFS